MSGQSRTGSGEALREELRALARKTRTFDAKELAKLATAARFEFTDEEIKAVAGQLSNELGEHELEQVAGGHMPGKYDYSKNVKV